MSANKPYIVGLTGGIATGKSTASRHLTSLGAYCIDADKLSHDLMNAGGGAVEPIRRMFGDEVILPDGSVDRRLLGRVVFPDAALRRHLEGIIHPMVQHITLECIEQAGKNGVPLVVLDVPLLFECGMDVLCDETWVVALSPERQLQRLMDRDGLSEQEALQRIASQMPLEEKMQRATVVIDNNRSEDKLKSELTALYHITLRRAERENS